MVILDVCTDDTAIWTPSPGGGVQGGLGGPGGRPGWSSSSIFNDGY